MSYTNCRGCEREHKASAYAREHVDQLDGLCGQCFAKLDEWHRRRGQNSCPVTPGLASPVAVDEWLAATR